jgi:protein SCO1/2
MGTSSVGVPRRRGGARAFRWFAIVALVAGLGVAIALRVGSSGTAPQVVAIPPDLFAGFVDDLGRPVSGRSAGKKYRLIEFGYTHCPDVCPLTLVAVRTALRDLGPLADRLEPVFVTVDPERDSVEVLHRHVSAFDPRIRAYRGDEMALNRLCERLKLQYWRETNPPGVSGYGISHSAILVLLRSDGTVSARIHFDENPVVLARSIVSAVKGAEAGVHAGGDSAGREAR